MGLSAMLAEDPACRPVPNVRDFGRQIPTIALGALTVSSNMQKGFSTR